VARDLAARLHVASGWLFVALWGLVVADLALHADAVRRAAEVALAILILLAMLKASPHIRALGGVLLTGTGLLAWSGGDWRLVERGLHAALAIGAFLPVVALVRTTVHASPAVPAIRERVGAMPDDERRAWMTTRSPRATGTAALASVHRSGTSSATRSTSWPFPAVDCLPVTRSSRVRTSTTS